MVIDMYESNLLKYNVTGDCLTIKLEGNLQSWTKYFEHIQFWSENEFLSPSVLLYNIEEEFVINKQHCTDTM